MKSRMPHPHITGHLIMTKGHIRIIIIIPIDSQERGPMPPTLGDPGSH